MKIAIIGHLQLSEILYKSIVIISLILDFWVLQLSKATIMLC